MPLPAARNSEGNPEITSFGAVMSNCAIEGTAGALHKDRPGRFYSRSVGGPTPGFLGIAERPSLSRFKDQPGVLPAPLIGSDSLNFTFTCAGSNLRFIPIVVKPDGTVFKGVSMESGNAPQVIRIPSPSQTGIYTVFLSDRSSDYPNGEVIVEARTSSRPKFSRSLILKPIGPEYANDFTSGEFIYKASDSKFDLFERYPQGLLKPCKNER